MSDEEPVCAQKGPYQVTLEAGRAYFWCSCGRSAKQPFCDGAHKTTSFAPHRFVAESFRAPSTCADAKARTTEPFCDGTHNML